MKISFQSFVVVKGDFVFCFEVLLFQRNYSHFGTFQIIFSHHASWFRQKSHQLLHKPPTSNTVTFKANGIEKVARILSFQHISSHIVMKYIQNQAEVIFISSTSLRETAYMEYKQYLILRTFLSLSMSWREPRQWSMVEGISHYRANITMFRQCAFWLILYWRDVHTGMPGYSIENIENRGIEVFSLFQQNTGVRHANTDQNNSWDTNMHHGYLWHMSLSLSVTPVYTEAQTKTFFMSKMRITDRILSNLSHISFPCDVLCVCSFGKRLMMCIIFFYGLGLMTHGNSENLKNVYRSASKKFSSPEKDQMG